MTGPLAEGASDLTANKDTSRLVVPPGNLRGGAAYVFSVQVVPEGDPSAAAVAPARVRVGSRGVEAGLAADSLVFAADGPVRLDGTLSKDRDNADGDLLVRCFWNFLGY